MDADLTTLEFPAELEWVNIETPPRLSDSLGRVTLVWFWSGDNVQCRNLLAEIRRLEGKYHDGLVVIGVHCPKYPKQLPVAAVLKAVNRFGVRHAVASDPGFRFWEACGVTAWPSVALFDADGALVELIEGEDCGGQIDASIARLLEHAATHDIRVFEGSETTVRAEPFAPLRFPGKLLATDKLLYIADSGNHRVLECDHSGRILRQFGSGNAGFIDGVGEQAFFHDPQGLALGTDGLYVADRGNHCVRRITLAGGEVRTILGTGERGYVRPNEQLALGVALNAPMDLALADQRLLVSVSGVNQIWSLDLGSGRVSVLAGSGTFGLADGAAAVAQFAQPAGLARVGMQLAVADSANSAIRVLRLADGEASTLVGQGPYAFGNVAGRREEALLQHPLAIASGGRGVLFVADSYNDSIKAVSVKTGEVRALGGRIHFQEPGGLCVAGGALWIANTNAHEIVRVDLANGSTQRVPVGE